MFIRTKDGKILKATQDIRKDIKEFGFRPIIGCDENETNQADTIEELCDEFVVVWESWEEHHEPCFTFGEIEQILEEYSLDNYKIYGAIWTDKGLIYVAKMNEKGELELL